MVNCERSNMQLVRLEVQNFRALRSATILFGSLTVLIGENDSGKSSVLDVLEMLLGTRKPDDKDFYSCQQTDGDGIQVCTQANYIEATAEFKLQPQDTAVEAFALNGSLIQRKRWTRDTFETAYRGRQVTDSRLTVDFGKLRKDELEDLINSLAPGTAAALKNNPERVQWLENFAANAPTIETWVTAPARWGEFLPKFERYRALDYSNPDSIVRKTLQQVYDQVIYEQTDDNGQPTRNLNKNLVEVKKEAETKIREKVAELLSFIQRYSPNVKTISYEPIIDFSGGLRSGEFQVDDGRGLHYLSRIGDGSKRRMFMATLDWDRQVTLQQAAQGGLGYSVIRGYDEPDTNLHYEAQRLMYSAIADIVDAQDSRVQAMLCTHSLLMVDRAPAKSINLLRLNGVSTVVERLETDNDAGVELFLIELARELGITNSLMFYEKCIVLIEGETEENALPLLYRSLYGRSMLEDGIRIVNTKGNGATKEFLRLLGRNRQHLSIAFLDRDTNQLDRGQRAKLTEAIFKEAGFSDEFITERIRYVGTREFEDSFDDGHLASAMSLGWPRNNGVWEAHHVASLRNERKLSDAIGRLVYEEASENSPRWGKPELGRYLGQICRRREQIPAAVVEMFELARRIAGCGEPGAVSTEKASNAALPES